MVKAVIFDLFETLVTESKHRPPQGLAVAELLGIDDQVYRTEWRKRQQARMTGLFPDYASAVIDTCHSLGQTIDHAMVHRIEQERITRFTRIFTDVDPEVLAAMHEIKKLDLALGLITNASADEVTAWEECPLSGIMDASILSCRVGHMKPDPAIYQIACDRLRVTPNECIYIGDGSFNELPAAAEFGMTTYCAAWYRDRWPDNTHPLEAGMFVKLRSLGEMAVEITKATHAPL